MKPITFKGIKTDTKKDNFYNIISIKKPSNEPNYYFLSNDIFKCNLKYLNKERSSAVFIGIANIHFFHVLSETTETTKNNSGYKRIIVVDSNFNQLTHFNRVKKYIINSHNRIEFIQKLFKVKFNSRAIKLLSEFNKIKKNYVHGGVKKDSFLKIEKKIWNNLYFNDELFFSTYKLKAQKTSSGIKIKSKTIGDINTYYATFICCSKKDYKNWPFTIAFGSGFLRNENSFDNLKTILINTPIYEINSDISTIYKQLLITNKYHQILFWTSNILCDYFIKKHKNLNKIINLSNKIGTQTQPNLPEIDLTILQDIRTAKKLTKTIDNLKNRKRILSIHSQSFSKICKYLSGQNNIEIVNVEKWIKEDNGQSKLPNTNYLSVNNFLNSSENNKFNSIIIHILLGHGISKKDYFNIVSKAKNISNNFIILEHNKNSKDFKRKKIGTTIEELRDMFGMESYLEFCPGKKITDRNILCVYKNK